MSKDRTPLQLYRGPEDSIPTLAEGEPGWTTDKHNLYIGNSDGTKTKLVSEKDIEPFATSQEVEEALKEKQDKISGIQGQVVGFDSEGNMIAQNAPETGVVSFNGRSGTVEPQQGDYTAEMVGARSTDWMPSANDVGAIPSSEKGTTDGVATLDENGKLTEAQKPSYTAEEVGAIPTEQKGSASGVATLDESGKLSPAQKPSYTAEEVGAIPEAKVGESNGVAPLGDNGLIPSQYIPGGLDEIQEYENKAGFPPTGEENIYYFDKETNLMYRWGGTTYVPVNPSLALGETQETAYRGDRGKIAYDHSQLTSGNPHNVTANEVGADPSGTANTKITEHNDSLEAHASLFNAKQDAANAVTITGGGTMIPPEESTGPWKMEFIAEETGEFPDANSISFNNKSTDLTSSNVQDALVEVNSKIVPGTGKKYTTVVVGTSNAGYTEDQVDFLCDGNQDEIEINEAIQSIISNPVGGTVLLLEGDYTTSGPIVFTGGISSIILKGCGRATVVRRTDTGSEDFTGENSVINVDSPEVEVSDLTVQWFRGLIGVYVNGANVILEHIFTERTSYPVYLAEMNATVKNCDLSGVNLGTGIFISESADGQNIVGNSITDASIGIDIADGNRGQHRIMNNYINTTSYGIRTGSTSGVAQKIAILSNSIYSEIGVELTDTCFCTVSGNEISCSKSGVILKRISCTYNPFGNTISGNGIFTGTGKTGLGPGILFDSDTTGNLITGNMVNGFNVGIEIGATDTVVSGNMVAKAGMWSSGDKSIYCRSARNLIVGNHCDGKELENTGLDNTIESNRT